MKKYLALILALAMALFCLAACSNSDEDADVSASSSTEVSDTTDEEDGDDEEEGTKIELVEAETEDFDGYAGVILDDYSAWHVKGVTSASQVQSLNDLRGPPMVLIEYEDDVIRIIGEEEIPDWVAEDEAYFIEIVLADVALWETEEEVDLEASGLNIYSFEVIPSISTDTEELTEGEIFACVVLDNGHVIWEDGVIQPSLLGEEASDNNVFVQVRQQETGAWEAYIIADAIPDWVTADEDSFISNITEAMAEWMGEA